MSFLKFKNKKGQEAINSILRWILYLGIAAVATFAFRAIIINASG